MSLFLSGSLINIALNIFLRPVKLIYPGGIKKKKVRSDFIFFLFFFNVFNIIPYYTTMDHSHGDCDVVGWFFACAQYTLLMGRRWMGLLWWCDTINHKDIVTAVHQLYASKGCLFIVKCTVFSQFGFVHTRVCTVHSL